MSKIKILHPQIYSISLAETCNEFEGKDHLRGVKVDLYKTQPRTRFAALV